MSIEAFYAQWRAFCDLLQQTDYPFIGTEFVNDGDYPLICTFDVERGEQTVIVFAPAPTLEMDALEYGQRFIEGLQEPELTHDLQVWTPELIERIRYWQDRDLLTGRKKT